jgi:hypothetical protein
VYRGGKWRDQDFIFLSLPSPVTWQEKVGCRSRPGLRRYMFPQLAASFSRGTCIKVGREKAETLKRLASLETPFEDRTLVFSRVKETSEGFGYGCMFRPPKVLVLGGWHRAFRMESANGDNVSAGILIGRDRIVSTKVKDCAYCSLF